MIELKKNELVFRFPDVHPNAVGRIDFMKTLRIPDDGRSYPLPAGLGQFHLEHIEDHAERLPEHWLKRGGVMLPMHQSEAMWINFSGGYPMAVVIATGKINAITGETWTNTLSDDPQNYVVLSEQPWLDGYAIQRGTVRQFVASALGQGETAEEQITGNAEFGGLQVIAFPMKADVYKEHFEREPDYDSDYSDIAMFSRCASAEVAEMGIAPGGKITQEIYEDYYGLDAWDFSAGSRCFIHTVNSLRWQDLTGLAMPSKPVTAKQYKEAGIPWFEYYGEDKQALKGSSILNKLKSIGAMRPKEEPVMLVDSGSIGNVIKVVHRGQVSSGEF